MIVLNNERGTPVRVNSQAMLWAETEPDRIGFIRLMLGPAPVLFQASLAQLKQKLDPQSYITGKNSAGGEVIVALANIMFFEPDLKSIGKSLIVFTTGVAIQLNATFGELEAQLPKPSNLIGLCNA